MILAVTALLRLQHLCPSLLHFKGVDNVSHVLGLALFRACFEGRHDGACAAATGAAAGAAAVAVDGGWLWFVLGRVCADRK